MQILPKILPINELENIENISKICKESDKPLVITKDGYSDMVIMNIQVYEHIISKLQTALLLNEALDDSNSYEDAELDLISRNYKIDRKFC